MLIPTAHGFGSREGGCSPSTSLSLSPGRQQLSDDLRRVVGF